MSKRFDSTLNKSSTLLLSEESRIDLAVPGDIDYEKIFRGTKGIYVDDDFYQRVVLRRGYRPIGHTSLLHRAVLDKRSDDEVRETFPAGHVFTDEELCPTVACLLMRALEESDKTFQNGGLLRSGQSNGFFALIDDKIHLVRIRRASFPKEWRVYLHQKGEYRWRSYDHLFRPDRKYFAG